MVTVIGRPRSDGGILGFESFLIETGVPLNRKHRPPSVCWMMRLSVGLERFKKEAEHG
jgi:hypothetical protein